MTSPQHIHSSPIGGVRPSAHTARARDWLGKLAQRSAAASAGLCLVRGEQFVPYALWGADSAFDAHALATARAAFASGRALREQPPGQGTWAGLRTRFKGSPAVLVLRYDHLEVDDEDTYFDTLIARCLRRSEDRAITEGKATSGITLLKSIDQPAPASSPEPPPKPDPAHAAAPSDEVLAAQGAAISALTGILDQQDLLRALYAMAERLMEHWRCQRVCIGLVHRGRARVKVMTGTADFSKRAEFIADVTEAMEETRQSRATITVPARPPEVVPRAHASLANQLKNPALCSVPLFDGERIVGVVLMERDCPFTEAESARVEQLSLMLGPVLALKRLAGLGASALLLRALGRPLAALFGSSHLTQKVLMLAVVALTIPAVLIEGTFRVGAQAQIEATTKRAVVASVDSFLHTVERRAGDLVREGDVLARLDTEQLELERIRYVGERDKLAKEYRAALAQRDRANVRVLEAQHDQAQAQVDLIDAQLARAVLRAPIDGVVTAGDLSQMVGTPIERGELLFEVATLDGYRLALMVDESDVGWLAEGNTGQIRLRSLPQQPVSFTVTSIVPVAEPGAGANRFRVEAQPQGLPHSIRPGMQGVAKIEIDSRPVGWIWTRSFLQWLRLQLWRLGF